VSSPAIEINSLSKMYRIYEKRGDRLKEALHPFKRKYHRDYYALRDINFEITRGDIIGIVGTNGSGKSTLLKIIAGVLSPTNGSISVNGKVSALLELGTGFNMEYTGMDNIYFNGMFMGYTRNEMEAKVPAIIDFADIGDFIRQPVKTYSSGMFARLAFAVAINVDPEILIIDEVLSVGDMYFQAKCMTKIRDLFKSGVTVLFVSHDTNSVKSLCNRAVYLDRGNFVMMGTAEEVVDAYAKDVRETMVAKNSVTRTLSAIDRVMPTSELSQSDITFKESSEFTERISYLRQGSKEVELTYVDVLNKYGEFVEYVEFDEEVTIRMYVKFHQHLHVSIGYHIRDHLNFETLGTSTVFEGIGEVEGDPGDRIVVDFKTKLPLIEGLYNISTVISIPTVHNRAATFVDYTENSYLFTVMERTESKLWNKVYVPNHVMINKVGVENSG